MICMKITVIQNKAVVCNQDPSPLLGGGSHAPLQIFHPLSKDDAPMVAPISQEADGIRHFSGIYVFMSLMRTPPPKVMNLDIGM